MTNIIAYSTFFIAVVYLILLFKTKSFRMNAEPLTSQNLFWAAIIIPILLFVSAGVICWDNYSFQLDQKSFDTFLSISKFPLALLSLSLPFGVVVNNIHRTIQTDKQIKESERKNKIDSFYSHRKNTIEVLDKLPFKKINLYNYSCKLSLNSSYSIYNKIYPTASISEFDYKESRIYFDDVEKLWEKLFKSIRKKYTLDTMDYYHGYYLIESILHEIHESLDFSPLENTKNYRYPQFNSNTDTDTDTDIYVCLSKFSDIENLIDAIRCYWHAYLTMTKMFGFQIPLNLRYEYIGKNLTILSTSYIDMNWTHTTENTNIGILNLTKP